MAYQTGSSSDVLDLLDKLRVFAIAQGWTVDEWTSPDLHISKGGRYFVLHGDTSAGSGGNVGPFLQICGATGYSAVAAWNAQPGTSPSVETNGMPGPFTAYHFFAGASPDYLHVVVEVSAGVFKHFHIGSLSPFGAIADGSYATGSRWQYNSGPDTNFPDHQNYHNYPFGCGTDDQLRGPSVLRVDTDGVSPKWNRFDSNYTTPAGYRATSVVLQSTSFYSDVWRSPGYALFNGSPNAFNGLTVLIPMPVFVERASAKFSPAGYVKDVRFVNMKNLTAGETLTIGTDQWLVFPAIQKTATWNVSGVLTPSSGYYGYAYKKIP